MNQVRCRISCSIASPALPFRGLTNPRVAEVGNAVAAICVVCWLLLGGGWGCERVRLNELGVRSSVCCVSIAANGGVPTDAKCARNWSAACPDGELL